MDREALRGVAAILREGDAPGIAWRIADNVRVRAQRRLDHQGRHGFIDRSRGREQMLMVVAGYKPYLWPHTLTRLERFLPEDIDVCIVCPGVAPAELSTLAARNGWSFLHTDKNALSLAQNLAIAHHPAARYLHKLDEDIFIAEGHAERLLEGYLRVKREGRYDPGFAAPVLNVNGFSYRLFLEALGATDAYRERFGELTQACMGLAAHHDGDAAKFLWDRSLPFDAVAAEFARRPFGYAAVPHRFSIGAFVMERELWETIGGFVVNPRGGLGHEERQLCQECVDLSRVMVVIENVFAGHFSFGPQDPVMRAAIRELEPGLAPPAPEHARPVV